MGCYNATVISASADEVWSALRNFHDLSWSANVVEDVEVVGDADATEPGARRVLNGFFHETLHELDDDERSLRYSIDNGPGPLAGDAVTGYFGDIKVLPITVPGDEPSCTVVWTSRWNGEEDSVHEFCDPIYRALLEDLRGHFA